MKRFGIPDKIIVVTAIVLVSATPGKTGGESETLAGHIWQWQHTLLNDDSRFDPPVSENYTLQFREDGSVYARVDCNRMSGKFSRNGADLNIELLLRGTRAMCPPESLDSEFERQIGDVQQMILDGDALHLDLKGHRGTMSFRR